MPLARSSSLTLPGVLAGKRPDLNLSRSLHKLLTKIFKLPSSFYFDDFPMFATAECAAETDSLISEFMDILGWNHAKTGSKAQPFSDVFSVLGMQIDLSKLSEGSVILSNKPGRIDRIVERLSVVSAEGRLTVHEAQVLLGLLNFSSGFFRWQSLKANLSLALWFPWGRSTFGISGERHVPTRHHGSSADPAAVHYLQSG